MVKQVYNLQAFIVSSEVLQVDSSSPVIYNANTYKWHTQNFYRSRLTCGTIQSCYVSGKGDLRFSLFLFFRLY